MQASISKRRGEEAAQAAEGQALESMEDVPSSSETQHLGITEDLRPAALIRKVSRIYNLHRGLMELAHHCSKLQLPRAQQD